MKLDVLLKLQFFYLLTGVVFNLLSYFMTHQIGQGLTPTDPIIGSLILGVYGLFLVAGVRRRLVTYRILMIIAIVLFGYGGIYLHFANWVQSPQLYHSLFAMVCAVTINVFGLVLNFYAALRMFQ